MLRYTLLHPPLLAALAATGHGGRVLIADGNFAHRTKSLPAAPVIHLNLSPGLLDVDQVLAAIVDACPIESAAMMAPDDGSTPDVEPGFRTLLGGSVPISHLPRAQFYDACRHPDLAAVVATADLRYFANILLTIGALDPGGNM